MSTTPNGVGQTAVPVLHAEPSTGPATILLAEDDRAVRRFMEVILRRAGYEVIVAADGLEAMKALLSSHVDALVTDAIMPHLTGYELCRFVRSHPQLASLPVALLSGVEQTTEASADVHLSKPVRPEALADSVARLLARDS